MHIISFVSQKGGVGKTTSAVNLSVAFAFGGYKVLLIDLDPQSSVRYSFGLEDVKMGTRELILAPNTPLKDLILHTKVHGNLDFIVSNITNLSEEKDVFDVLSNYSFLSDLLRKRKLDYDYVIIDAPSSTNNLAINALVAADLIVLPLQCENLAIKSLKRFLVSFHELQTIVGEKDLRLAGILLTRFNSKNEVHQRIASQLYHSLSEAVFQSIIPEVDEIVEASALGQPVLVYKLQSIGSTAYIRLMKELMAKFDLEDAEKQAV